MVSFYINAQHRVNKLSVWLHFASRVWRMLIWIFSWGCLSSSYSNTQFMAVGFFSRHHCFSARFTKGTSAGQLHCAALALHPGGQKTPFFQSVPEMQSAFSPSPSTSSYCVNKRWKNIQKISSWTTKKVRPTMCHIICLWDYNTLQSSVTGDVSDPAGDYSSLWPEQSDFFPLLFSSLPLFLAA